MFTTEFAFVASTGRTATMFIASTLDSLPHVISLHEGHKTQALHEALLPPINTHNRKAWQDTVYASKIVAELRSQKVLSDSAGQAQLIVDVAYYNASILKALMNQFTQGLFIAIFRRCEAFVRSATIVSGEDLQPAGWPERSKTLTDREKFISIGRLKPHPSSPYADRWHGWTAVQRNIWLWVQVNSHLLHLVENHKNCRPAFYEDLLSDPGKFWQQLLSALRILNESNLDICIAKSEVKINQRETYQIGTLTSWSEAEVALYREIACPLENRLYDRLS